MHINKTTRHACQNPNPTITPCRRTRPKTTLLATAVLGTLFALVQPDLAIAQATTQLSWNLPAGPLDQALGRLAEQSKLTISYAPDLVKGKTTRGLSGAYTPTEALRRLLAGTGLTFDALNATTFVLRPAPTPAPANSTGRNAPAASTPPQQAPTSLANVVVTGTRIPGVQPSSPLVTISQDDMRLAGDNNLGDVIRSLPENFNGGQNPGVLTGAGGGVANQNITGGSSLNLRGLGPDATLTLLNGARLPYDGFSQATDVAVIPIAAIDHMDVLLDGASAIYGSDAVGGVANIVLKRDYDGAEITERTGGATDGGYNQNQVSFVGGSTWASGGLLVAAESDSSGAVNASQRDYLSYVPDPNLLTIYPETSQHGVLVSGHQDLGSDAELTLDAFLTRRSMSQTILFTPYSYDYGTQSDIYGISPSLRIELANDWSLRVHAFEGEDDTQAGDLIFDGTGTQIGQTHVAYDNQTTAADVDLEGALFALPGGDARASFGGGWSKVQFEEKNLISDTVLTPEVSNSDRYLYGEINLPVATKLSLNGALRYDDYDSFGSTTNPKIGALWNVTPSVDVRASWGTSFKAPTLLQQYDALSASLRTASAVGIAGAPSNATVLVASGGNPALTPEKADVTTAGIEFHPQSLPGASMELGWFDIDYTQRVVQPFQFASLAQYGSALNSPVYAEFITKNPSAAQQSALVNSAVFYNFAGANYDPSNVVAIFNNRYVNAASQTIRGIDLDLRYTTPMLAGSLNVDASGSWITNAERKISDLAPEIATAGVVAFPPKFKSRLTATWSRSSFSLTTAINYLGGVTNTNLIPSPRGASMTTVDLIADYAAEVGQLKGLGFNVSVLNIFNRRPPYLDPEEPYYVNYDSTNYSPLGRVINVSITKRF